MLNDKIPPKKACLISLGCKVSKYEIDCMANILKDAGWEVTLQHEPADLYIVNTCAVTNEGEKKSRQYISKLSSLNPNAKIIVCGCASENNIDQFKKPNVVSIIGNEGKENILDLIDNPRFEKFPFYPKYNKDVKNPFKSQTRAYLKIQDGCNNFCSYCLIPYVRGRSRSREFEDIMKEAEVLSQSNSEIVLTGIDMSSFKIDNELGLGKLVYAMHNLPARIRIGSLEVNVITSQFLEYLKLTPNFCPQFHLSLQSGSDTVLKRMNRHYTKTEYLEKVNLIKQYFPLANITTDVIVGFAGETDEEFEETCDTCIKAGFGNMHIFPYSKRKGTMAYNLPVPNGNIVKDRIKKLEEIRTQLCNSYFQLITGKTFELLVEEKEDEYFTGYTENYVKVYAKDNLEINKFYKAKMLKCFKQGMLVEVVK